MKQVTYIIVWTVYIFLAGGIGTAPSAIAQLDTIEVSYKYVMGDNDTKADARNICFLNAKKLCLEKAGTYVISQLSLKKREVQGRQSEYAEITEQDIRTFMGALIKVDVIGESLSTTGESIAISMTIRAIINSSAILEQILAVKEDQSLAKRIKEQQEQLAAMEAKIRELQAQLKTATPDLTKPARVERVEIFAKMSELEAIKFEIARKTKLAVDYVELGMTRKEVESLIGPPRSIATNYLGIISYNYGNVWVIFENGVVSCIVRADKFIYYYGRRDYSRIPGAILK